MTIYVSLIVALIGLLMFGFCANAKLARVGEILLASGCLAFLLMFGQTTIHTGPK